MKKIFHRSLLISASVATLALIPACGGSSGDDDSSGGTSGSGGTGGSTTGGTGGSTTGGTGGGGTGGGTGDYTVSIDPSGWVDGKNVGNDVGVQGAWYPYGDQYGDGPGDAKCTKIGLHMPTECAQITSPAPPPAMGFPNTNGEMHTTGTVEVILPCPDGLTTSGCPTKDYSNMWGSGIGFDFNANPGPPDGDGAKHMWDPDMYGVVGIAFTIHGLPLGNGLRVEFPQQLTDEQCAADTPALPAGCTTDNHSAGAPYWGAQAGGDGMYKNAVITDGMENKIFFDDTAATTGVESPKKAAYLYDRHRMLGIQFHVVAGSNAPYDFTISNVRFLRTR